MSCMSRAPRLPFATTSGEVSGGALVFHDVSESRELNRRLSYHASHDVLTGLVNRREFENRLDRALKSAQVPARRPMRCCISTSTASRLSMTRAGIRPAMPCSDNSGRLLKSRIRWRDCLSRLGGDEFGVLLESCSLDEAMRSADSSRPGHR